MQKNTIRLLLILLGHNKNSKQKKPLKINLLKMLRFVKHRRCSISHQYGCHHDQNDDYEDDKDDHDQDQDHIRRVLRWNFWDFLFRCHGRLKNKLQIK